MGPLCDILKPVQGNDVTRLVHALRSSSKASDAWRKSLGPQNFNCFKITDLCCSHLLAQCLTRIASWCVALVVPVACSLFFPKALRRVLPVKSPALSHSRLAHANLHEPTCTSQLARANLHEPTYTSQLARANLHSQLTRANLHEPTCSSQLAQPTYTSQLARANLHEPTCPSQLA